MKLSEPTTIRPLRAFDNQGFTLVELMVTLVIAFLVIAAVYASYIVQQRTQIEQQQVTHIQQNLRAGLAMIAKEFKMAGYDPTLSGEYSITTAEKDRVAFTADLCEDGGTAKATAVVICPGPVDAGNNPTDPDQPKAGQRLDETFIYQLFDSDLDGNPDALQRVPTIPGPPPVTIPIAENIEKLEFRYIMKNGSVLEKVTTNREDIRAIQINILARAEQPDYRYTNQQTYDTSFGDAWDPAKASDFSITNSLNYRRRILLATIELRNMGLL